MTTDSAAAAWLEKAGLELSSAQLIDVSNFQGRFNWAGQHGLSGGIYRLTQGLGHGVNSPDPTAQWNHDQLKRLSLEHGAYHFLDPRLDGAAQAQYFVTEHQRVGLTARDMLWLDNEDAAGQGAGTVAGCARAFMAELDKLCPHNPRGVYSYINFIQTGHCAGLSRYPLWLAFPASKSPVPPPPWHNWTFWQWGIRNGTDRDAFNGTAAGLAAWLGSFAPSHPDPPAKKGVLHGKVASTDRGWDGRAATSRDHGKTWTVTNP